MIKIILASAMLILLTTSCTKEEIKPNNALVLNVTEFDGEWTLITINGQSPNQPATDYTIANNQLTTGEVYSDIQWTNFSSGILNGTDQYGFALSNGGNTLTMAGANVLILTK